MTALSTENLFQWPRWALSRGDRTALIFESQSGELIHWTWRDLAIAVDVTCHRIEQADFVAGDRLVHSLGNSAEAVLVALASMAVGTIEVPLEPISAERAEQFSIDLVSGRLLSASTGDEIATWATNARSASQSLAAKGSTAVARLLARYAAQAADAPSLILFTSGSSGRCKAVTLSRRNLCCNANAKLLAVPQRPDDVRLTVLPIYHGYARTCDLATWLISGSTLVITAGWDGWLRLAPIVRPTLVNTVPSLALRLLDMPTIATATTRLRLVGCGGAALAAEAFEQFTGRGMTLIQGYGMTEASPVICSARPDDARPGWVGCPVEGWQTAVDSDGRLSVRGPAMMLGYWNDPTETSRRIVAGWLDTGDIVEVDHSSGQFRILGRADDRIVLANGRKLYPAPLEQRVVRVSGVRHAIVVGADRHVELWLDVEPHLRAAGDWAQRVASTLDDLPKWQTPRSVCIIPESLQEVPGAFTLKMTPVRNVVTAMIDRVWRNAITAAGPAVAAKP